MAAPAPIVSNPVTVTEAGAPALTLTVDQASLPYTGGPLNFTVASQNLADGTVVHLLKDGQDTGATGTISGNAAAIPYADPANESPSPVTDTFTVST